MDLTYEQELSLISAFVEIDDLLNVLENESKLTKIFTYIFL